MPAPTNGELALAVEVVLQRNHRRQMLGAGDTSQTAQRDVVLERQRSRYFDAQVVGNEVFRSEGGLDVLADVRFERTADQAAVIGFGRDLVGTDGNGPVAFGLSQCGDAGEGGGQAGEQKGRAHAHGNSVVCRGWKKSWGFARWMP